MKYSSAEKEFIFDNIGEGTWSERIKDLKERFSERFGKALEVRDGEALRVLYSRISSQINSIREVREVLQDMNDSVVEDRKYEVDGNDYVFKRKRKDAKGLSYVELIRIPIQLADDIHMDYSSHGKDLSQQQIIDKYKLKGDVWLMIKSRFELNKFSNVVSPEGLKNIESQGEEAVKERIREGCYEAIEDKYKTRYKLEYYQILEMEAKKAMKKLASYENFAEFLRAYIENYEPKKFTLNPQDGSKYENSTLDVGLSDIHMGKLGTGKILERFVKLTKYLIARPERNINLLCLGDLVETMAEGGMHSGQVEGMEGVYGYDLMMITVELFESFIIDLVQAGKTISFYGMGGNHDRVSKMHNEDKMRLGALAIYELIKRGLQNIDAKIQIITEKTKSLDLDNFQYIINHGDEGFDRRKMEEVLWKYGDRNRHNIIMYGDKHHFIGDETLNATKIGLPALAGAGDFDTRNGYFSEPGVVIIERNEDGLPDITIKRLK